MPRYLSFRCLSCGMVNDVLETAIQVSKEGVVLLPVKARKEYIRRDCNMEPDCLGAAGYELGKKAHIRRQRDIPPPPPLPPTTYPIYLISGSLPVSRWSRAAGRRPSVYIGIPNVRLIIPHRRQRWRVSVGIVPCLNIRP